jgi:cytochrome c5
MKSPFLAILATAVVVPVVSAAPQPAKPAPAQKTATAAAPAAAAQVNDLVSDYCSGCHHDGKKSGGVSFETFDIAKVTSDPDLGERMIKKLRTGLMPPPTAKRPEADEAKALVESLEQRLDRAAALKPNPGFRPFQRLNRAEYARSVRDLLAIDVDVNAFLPPDTMSHGFDNVADAQTFSPTLMEGYLRAASKVSSLALGDRSASATETTYRTDRTAAQLDHVEGAPFGTRGGISVVHTFPADGDYSFRMMLHSVPTGQLFGSTVKGEQIEVSIDGERVSLLPINTRMSETDPNGMNLQTLRVYVTAGPHRVSAAFIQKFEAPVDDLLTPIDYTLADTQIGSGYGITALPHLRDFAITGPLKVTGISDTPSRRRIFSCRPTLPAEEASCAREIVQNLSAVAYRGNVNAQDLAGLMSLYEQGRTKDGFEGGVKMALQAILASPRFLFRLEETPTAVKAGDVYRISDLELASRLSFFLWGSGPDAELLKAAKAQTLSSPMALDRQVKRMLLDPRAEALSTRFASQWLRLQDLDKIRPDALLYPFYDATLADGLRKETQLLFGSIVREDRSVLDILNADYTFVNERVARHYGIPNVSGPQFRRVDLKGTPRRGVLGQGSVLALTSVADRTSPVQRGKWILEVLLNSSPPPPPPTVPLLEETKGVTADGKVLTVRQRMEEHRKNPACVSCHRVIDPLGLALENFDVDGRWRIKDSGEPVDAVGRLYDGTTLAGPEDLRKALLGHSEAVLRSFTEYLMTYALGRRIEPSDGPTVRAIVRDASKNGYRFSSFALGVAKSAPFTRGRAQQVPAQRAIDMADTAAKAIPQTAVSR